MKHYVMDNSQVIDDIKAAAISKVKPYI